MTTVSDILLNCGLKISSTAPHTINSSMKIELNVKQNTLSKINVNRKLKKNVYISNKNEINSKKIF